MQQRSTDIAVVGAGIIGASTAWRLAQSGARVCLFDAAQMGGEASWAGAGMLAPGGEICTRSPWADFALESLRAYADFVAELEQESGESIDYRRCGAVEIALSVPEWEDLRRRAAAQRAMGISALECGEADWQRRLPPLGVAPVGALLYPDDALVDPRQIMQALRVALGRRQARLLENSPVTAIRAGAGAVEIHTARDCFRAGAAVLAAGAWSSAIPITVDDMTRQLPAAFPVRGHLLGYRLEPGLLHSILRHGHTYLLQRASGFIIAGTSSEEVGFDRRLDPAVTAAIHARACQLLPRLAATQPSDAWIGFRPAAAGSAMQVTRFEESRVWLAYGHFRNGILLAPATAARLSREISASSETGSPLPAGSG